MTTREKIVESPSIIWTREEIDALSRKADAAMEKLNKAALAAAERAGVKVPKK